MTTISKRKKAWATELDRTKKHSVKEALELAKKYAGSKFKERMDLVIRLGIDPRKSDQMVRSSVILPHGTGQTLRVAVFAKGEKEKEAKEAGADFVGAEDLAEKITGGFFDFDRLVATPDMMALVGKLGKILGPKGLMPNPKTGTVTLNVGNAVTEIKKGQVQFRTDKGANVHCTLGMADFEVDHLQENLQAVVDQLVKLKPASAKGLYVKSVFVSTTMGPGIRIDEQNFR